MKRCTNSPCKAIDNGTFDIRNEYGCVFELECPHCPPGRILTGTLWVGSDEPDLYCSGIPHENGYIFPHNFE